MTGAVMEERRIRLPNQRWKNPPMVARSLWTLSAKGNLYARNRDGHVVVISGPNMNNRYSLVYSQGNERWERLPGEYASLDDAKAAGLAALGVVVRTPVPPDPPARPAARPPVQGGSPFARRILF